MKKKSSFFNKKVIILAIAISSIGIGSNVAEDYFEISKNIEVFTDVYKNINLFYTDETKPGELMKIGIDAMLRSLDPYTVYIPESRMEDFKIMNTGQYGGIGASIRTIDGNMVITEPYKDFPAQKSGIEAGDIIRKVDGRDTKELDQEELSDIFKGQPGTTVNVTIDRFGEEINYTLTREDIQIPNVPYYGIIKDKIGYIKLNKFTRTASSDIKSAYLEMEEQGMDKLIIDLRGNTGGLLREAINIVNFFVPKGTEIVSTKGRLKEWEKTYKAINQPLSETIPLAIVVGPGSASASEVVSGSLQDLDRAIIIGSETYGKGLVQQTKDIAYNSKVKLTIAKYYTPSGRCIQKLDYSHKNHGLAEEVPDSLITAFRTKAGREVFDGRGIDPDVDIDNETMGAVVSGLLEGNYLFKYSNLYKKNHKTISNPIDFKLSDQEFTEFANWMDGKEVDYSNESEAIIQELIETTKEELYYDSSSSELNKLADLYKPNIKRDILKYKDQIKSILDSEIVSRYYYQEGRIKNILKSDRCMEAAYENFDPSKYNNILRK